MAFAIIGLVCTHIGCYWVHDDYPQRTYFSTQEECAFHAATVLPNPGYFSTACIYENVK